MVTKSQGCMVTCVIQALSIVASIKHFSPYIVQYKHRPCILADSKLCLQASEKRLYVGESFLRDHMSLLSFPSSVSTTPLSDIELDLRIFHWILQAAMHLNVKTPLPSLFLCSADFTFHCLPGIYCRHCVRLNKTSFSQQASVLGLLCDDDTVSYSLNQHHPGLG